MKNFHLNNYGWAIYPLVVVSALFLALVGLAQPAASGDGKGEPNASSQRGESSKLDIKRDYKEAALVDIFRGSGGQPAFLSLAIGTCELLGKYLVGKPFPHQGGADFGEIKVLDGFKVGSLHFDHEILTVDFRLLCGSVFNVKEPDDHKRITFAEAENYLSQAVLKPTTAGLVFKTGSFTDKPIGEAVWHRADEKQNVYELVTLRGLTIVHIRVTLKQNGELQKTIGERLDAIGAAMDTYLKRDMWMR
jgi:hypothetical protein